MNFDQHDALATIKQAARSLHETLDSELRKTRAALEKLNTEEARKKYSPEHLRGKIDEAKKAAKAAAINHTAKLKDVEAKIAAARDEWSTERALRRAINTMSEANTNTDKAILAELRLMRVGSQIANSSPQQLVGMIRDAAEFKDLMTLALIQQAASRMTGSESVQVKVTLQTAISEIEIYGQKPATVMLDQTAQFLEDAEDAAHELETGQESHRARRKRVTVKHADAIARHNGQKVAPEILLEN